MQGKRNKREISAVSRYLPLFFERGRSSSDSESAESNRASVSPSADLRSNLDGLLRVHQRQVSCIVLRTEDHALRNHACQLCRLQVCDDQNFLSDHLLRLVPLLDAGQDLACLRPDLHL